MVVGAKEAMEEAKEGFQHWFDCDDAGGMDEYLGCKLERNWDKGWIKFTQPVLIQSLSDEFNFPEDGPEPLTPIEAGKILMPCKEGEGMDPVRQTKYISGVGKLLHMMR